MTALFQDLRFALRQLGKNRVFTIIVVATLALGIGANTAIFTLIDDLMLKSLPVRDPQNLVAFGEQAGAGVIDGIGPGPLELFPYDFYKQIENQREVFDSITGYASFTSRLSVRLANTGTNSSATPSATSSATQAAGHLVAGNFFQVLGATMVLGKTTAPSDAETPGSNAVAVISYQYWQREFSADRDVVGKTIVINGAPYTVIGVAAPRFYGVALDQFTPDMWLPLTMQAQVQLGQSLLGPRGLYFLHLMGRRKAGVKLEQMQEWTNLQLRRYISNREGAQLTAARTLDIQKIYAPLVSGGRGVSVLRVIYNEPLRILMALVAMVLLVACANLANFLLSKAASREREICTRMALGASRSRIVFQMLAEALMISFLGGAAGLLLASWGTRILINFVLAGANSPFNPNPDIRVLAFTLGLSLLTGILFGLAPALRLSRVSVAPGLGASARSVAGAGSRTARILPKMLVAVQVGVGLVLVLAAGLLTRTLRNIEQQDLGFNRQNLLFVSFDSQIAGYKPEQARLLNQRILDRVRTLPGVRNAALSSSPLISMGSWSCPAYPKGYTAKPDEDTSTKINSVSDRYFETVGIPVLSGRPIESGDVFGSRRVVVVNQTVANHYFPRGNAVGQSMKFDQPDLADGDWEIVGVARNAKYNDPRETNTPMVYLPTAQLTGGNAFSGFLQLQTAGDPGKLGPEVRHALAEIDANLPIVDVESVQEHISTFNSKETLISQLSIFFSLLALLMACIGLYGVMTNNVLRRTNEIGVRMALGAQTGGVLWLVLKESIVLLGIGLALGIPAALAVARLLQSQLFAVQSSDPWTIFVAVLVVTITTLVAGYLPAWRATRIDPLVALRYE
jgi:predicted permease